MKLCSNVNMHICVVVLLPSLPLFQQLIQCHHLAQPQYVLPHVFPSLIIKAHVQVLPVHA